MKTLFALLTALALAASAHAQNATSVPLRNATLQTPLNASGYGITSLGNVTFGSATHAEQFLSALGIEANTGNRTVRQANRLYDLVNGEWAMEAGDDEILINGPGRLVSLQDAIFSGTPASGQAFVDSRFLWRLANWYYRERDIVGSPLSPGIVTYSTNGTIGNGGSANGSALALTVNATAPGNATAAGLMPGGFIGNGPGAIGDNVLVWNRPMVMWVDLIAEAWRSGNTVRIYWGQSDTWRSGPMSEKGVGFEITAATARGAVRNASTSTTTTTASLLARRNYRLTITLNGTNAEFFVNGTSLGTLAVPTGSNAWPAQQVVAVIENDGTAASTYLMLLRTGFGFQLQP